MWVTGGFVLFCLCLKSSRGLETYFDSVFHQNYETLSYKDKPYSISLCFNECRRWDSLVNGAAVHDGSVSVSIDIVPLFNDSTNLALFMFDLFGCTGLLFQKRSAAVVLSSLGGRFTFDSLLNQKLDTDFLDSTKYSRSKC